MVVAPLVSVKMITYNHAPYIADAIEGVLMQKTSFPFELVIGEDCSTDGTRQIVYQYADAHPDVVRVITSQRNVGIRANSLRATLACRGDYIAWCEGDDYWHSEDKLQMQVDYLEANSDYGLVYSDCDYSYVSANQYLRSFNAQRGLVPPTDPTVRDVLLGRCGVHTCTACARIDLVRAIYASDPELYQSGKFLMGDTPLWADISSRSKVHYFPVSMAVHRILPNSAAHSESIEQQQRFYVSNREMCVYVGEKHLLPTNDIRLLQAKRYDASLFLAFIEGDKKRGHCAWEGLMHPTFRQCLMFWSLENKALNWIVQRAWGLKRFVQSRTQLLRPAGPGRRPHALRNR